MKALLIGPENPHFAPHLRTLQALDEIEEIALSASIIDEHALLTPYAQMPKVGKLFASVYEALLDPVDVVMACPRNDRALAIAIQVLRAGKPLLAEKPCGRNAAETLAVVDAADAANVTLGVAYVNRAHPATQAARRFVQDGLLGELMHVELRWFTTQPRFRDPSHWLFNRQQAGGGIVHWLGCHLLDLAHYVSGRNIMRASAALGTCSGEAIEVEDVAALNFVFDNGAVGSLDCGYVLAQAGAGYENRAGNDTHIAFIGTKGRISWSHTGAPCILHAESTDEAWRAQPQRVITVDVPDSPAYGGKYGEAFVRAFLRGEPMASGHDALRVMRVLDEVYLPFPHHQRS